VDFTVIQAEEEGEKDDSAVVLGVVCGGCGSIFNVGEDRAFKGAGY